MIFTKIFWKLFLATMFSISRHNCVSNMDTLSQTMPREWSYLVHLIRNLYMYIDDWSFCEEVFWKLCQDLSLSFLLATSIHKRTPCQNILFFEYFFNFFYFVEKMVKMAAMPIHWKGSHFSKLSTFMWCTRWHGCHIWIPLIFLIDLDILFVKFQIGRASCRERV